MANAMLNAMVGAQTDATVNAMRCTMVNTMAAINN